MRAKRADIQQIESDDEWVDSQDIYSEDSLDNQQESGIISSEEQGFMMGYLAAGG